MTLSHVLQDLDSQSEYRVALRLTVALKGKVTPKQAYVALRGPGG
jgi:hypothetical protein